MAQEGRVPLPVPIPTASRCVVVATPEERSQALTAISIAERGDREGLQTFVQANRWIIEERSFTGSAFFVISAGAVRVAEGRIRLDTDLLELLLKSGGGLDLSTNPAARALVAEWIDAVLSPSMAHFATARGFISNFFGAPLAEVLQKGLTRVDLMGRVWLMYRIPGVDGSPMVTVEYLPFSGGESPNSFKPDSVSQQSFDNKNKFNELIILFSSGVPSDQRDDTLIFISEIMKILKQNAINEYKELIKQVKNRLSQSWKGPQLDEWHSYEVLSSSMQNDVLNSLQSMRKLFESMGQSFPQGGLPAGSQISYALIPTAYLTLEYNGRKLQFTLEIGEVEHGSPLMRSIDFVPANSP